MNEIHHLFWYNKKKEEKEREENVMIEKVKKMNVRIQKDKWITTLKIACKRKEKVMVEIIDEMHSNKQSIISINNDGNIDVESLLKELQRSSFDYDAKETIKKLKSLDQLTFSKKNVEIKNDSTVDFLMQIFPQRAEEMKKIYLLKINEMKFKVYFDGEKITDIYYHEDVMSDDFLTSNEYVSIKGLFVFEYMLETYMQHITRLRNLVDPHA
jgi:hypothetical protein